MKLLKSLLVIATFSLLATSVNSQDKEEKLFDKITQSSAVLEEFSKMKENIPAELLKMTQGIIIVPNLVNAGFVIAGKRGKGIAIVKNSDGTWSNPAFITLTGGSVGFQAGVQKVDLVLIFKKRETLENISKGSFTLGGDISVAAGPVGRSSTASTDYKLDAEVYSYSKAKGLFAGISLSGSSLSVDAKSNEKYYNSPLDAASIFADGSKDTSNETATLKETLSRLDL